MFLKPSKSQDFQKAFKNISQVNNMSKRFKASQVDSKNVSLILKVEFHVLLFSSPERSYAPRTILGSLRQYLDIK